MRYGKIVNGALILAPNTVTWRKKKVNNPSDAKLKELEFKPIVESEMPENAPTDMHYEYSWEDDGEQIVKKWNLVKNPEEDEVVFEEPTDSERLDALEQAFLEFVEVMVNG